MNATKKYQIWVKVRNSFEYWTLYTEKDTLKEAIEKEKEAIRVCFAIDTMITKKVNLVITDLEIEDDLVVKIDKKIKSLVGYGLNETGKKIIRGWVKKFNITDLFDSIEISFNQYYTDETDWDKFFDSIPKIANKE